MTVSFDKTTSKYTDDDDSLSDFEDDGRVAYFPELEETESNLLLYYSGEGKNLFQVKRFIDNGVSIDCTDEWGTTPLLSAAENGNIDIAKFLIDNKANIHHIDKDGQTCLHYACINGSVSITMLFIVNGTRINEQDLYGNTCLHNACTNGHIEIVQLLLQHNIIIDVYNFKQQTALIATCINVFGKLEEETKYIINLLIQNGANTEDLKSRIYHNKEIQRYVHRLCAYKWLQIMESNEK